MAKEFTGIGIRKIVKTRKPVLLRIDNITTIAYINRMGGIQKRKLSTLAKDIYGNGVSNEIFGFSCPISARKIIGS